MIITLNKDAFIGIPNIIDKDLCYPDGNIYSIYLGDVCIASIILDQNEKCFGVFERIRDLVKLPETPNE